MCPLPLVPRALPPMPPPAWARTGSQCHRARNCRSSPPPTSTARPCSSPPRCCMCPLPLAPRALPPVPRPAWARAGSAGRRARAGRSSHPPTTRARPCSSQPRSGLSPLPRAPRALPPVPRPAWAGAGPACHRARAGLRTRPPTTTAHLCSVLPAGSATPLPRSLGTCASP